MRIFKFGWLPLAVLALLAAGSLPAIAGAPTTADGLLQSTNPNREHCVNVGLALAAMSEEGLVAETMSLPSRNTPSLTSAATRRIVVDAPAAVGACVDFEGVWGDGTVGGASLQLSLLGPATSAALAPAMASANLSERGRGPQRIQRKLEALAKFEKPGIYQLTALVELTATKGGANSIGSNQAGETARDSMKVPFTVELRAASGRNPQPGPGPAPAPLTAVSGKVVDADGNPIVRAMVQAAPVATGAIAAPPNTRRNSTWTDENGEYLLELKPGAYAVGAMRVSTNIAGGPMRWWDGKDAMEDADPILLREGELREDVNFGLD